MDTLPDIGQNPDYGLSGGGKFAVDRVQFGDGYQEVRPAGLNSTRRSWRVTWSLLDRAQRDTLREFLVSKRGAYAFLCSPDPTGPQVAVRCPEYPEWTHDTYGRYTLNATFEEAFVLNG